jgi:hypothetical protein
MAYDKSIGEHLQAILSLAGTQETRSGCMPTYCAGCAGRWREGQRGRVPRL